MTIEVNIDQRDADQICKAGLLTEEELKQYLLQRFMSVVSEERLEAEYINTGCSTWRITH